MTLTQNEIKQAERLAHTTLYIMTLTQNEIKQAERLAHTTNLMLAKGTRSCFAYRGIDLRTRVGKLAMKLIKQDEFQKNAKEIRQKQKLRRERKLNSRFVNIFERPIVKDYLANPYINVHSNRLSDGLRNHWAKDDKDLKILSILKK